MKRNRNSFDKKNWNSSSKAKNYSRFQGCRDTIENISGIN